MKVFRNYTLGALVAVAMLAAIMPARVYSQQAAILFGSFNGAAKAITATTDGYLNVSVVSGSIPASVFTATRNGISSTLTDAFLGINNTAAAAGAQQFSPSLRLVGQGWKTDATAASQTVDWQMYVVPVQGAAAPTSELRWAASVNLGASTDRMTLSSVGLLTVTNLTASTSVLCNTQCNIAGGGAFRSSSNGTKITMPADGEITTQNNAATINAGQRSLLLVEVNTTSKSPSALENNEVYTNTGDADGSTATLPNDPAIGSLYHFVATVAQTVTISPSAGETIRDNGATCADVRIGAAIGESLTLVAAVGGSGGMWVPMASHGGFTCTP